MKWHQLGVTGINVNESVQKAIDDALMKAKMWRPAMAYAMAEESVSAAEKRRMPAKSATAG
jgi:hypothetical protein